MSKNKELDEALGHGTERASEHSWASTGNARPAQKAKYLVKHRETGKVHSVHTDAPSAVRARNKIGGAETHSIVKESVEDIMEQVKSLIDAIESGKTVSIESTFNEIMSSKLADAIESRRGEIASNLFTQTEATTEE